MAWPDGLRERARALLRKSVVERELAEEIEFHVERATEKNIRAGMSPEEARRAALLSFGGVERAKEEHRRERGVQPLDELIQDIRYGARTLRRNPGFALAAVCTLALGIGATTAIFSVVEAVLLRPLPYDNPARLALIWNRTTETGSQRVPIAAPDVAIYRERAQLFEGFAFSGRGSDAVLNMDGQPFHARLGRVSANFFSLLGVAPVLGRDFSAGRDILPPEVLEDTTIRRPAQALILSHDLWHSRFGSDPEIIGKSIELDDQSAVVVGVMPEGFNLVLPEGSGVADDAQIWSPISVGVENLRRPERLRDQDSDNTGAVIARLKDRASLPQAQAEMDGVATQLRREVPTYAEAGLRVDVQPMHADVVSHVRPILFALMGGVSLVLLIVCINVANLMLVRTLARQRELALRSALGAQRRRLLKQMLTESGLLALLGGALGVTLAAIGVDSLVAIAPHSLPRVGSVTIDTKVMAFALVATALCALLFGSVPALTAARRRGSELLNTRGLDASLTARRRIRDALVVAEIALSLVLLIGAGLMLKSFTKLSEVRPGFDTAGVMTFNLSLRRPDRYRGPADRARFLNAVQERLSSLPAVEAVAAVGGLPLSGRSWTQPYGLPGESEPEWSSREADFRTITSGYLSAMGIRLIAGRPFTKDEDLFEHGRVVIIDEKMARRISSDGNAIGRMIGFPLDGEPVWGRVVGVVEHVRYASLHEDGRETLYVPYRQEASRELAIVVRANGDPANLVVPIRDEIRALDPGLPLYDVRPLQDLVDAAVGPTRFVLTVLTIFAAASLVLALVGLHGVLSHWVRQRTQEIGIRMALGATGNALVRRVVGRGLLLTGVGLAAGFVLFLVASRALDTLLFGVARIDAGTVAGVSLLLAFAATLACYLPARQASRIDPLAILRIE